MKALVCGGRDFADYPYLAERLDYFRARIGLDVLIHGAAHGADTLASDWANARGVAVLAFPADWSANGKAAGPMRNRQMLLDSPDYVIAFKGGKGTANLVRQALAMHIPVHHHDDLLPAK